MPKAPKAPAAPNPAATLAMQNQANKDTGIMTQNLNMVDQSDPFGSLGFTIVGYNADGTPKYQAKQSYNPEQQALLDQLVGTKGTTGAAGGNLASDAFSYLSEVPDFTSVAGSLTEQGINRQLPAFERFQKPAREQLDTQLRTQGILPGTPAYQQQMDKLLAQQDLNTGSWMNSFQQQAFGQAKDQYTMPADMIMKLMNSGAPMDLKGSFMDTPKVNMQAGSAQAAVDAEMKAKQFAYQQAVAKQNMLMSLGLTAAGTVMGGPIGGSIGSGISNMFGGGSGSGMPNDSGAF